MTRHARCFLRGEDGAVAVEFVLVLPLLLAILFGIICFGQYFAIANSLQQLAAEGARRSVLELTEASRLQRAEGYISEAHERFPMLDSGKVSYSVQSHEAAGPGIAVTVTYDLSGSAIDVVDGFIGLDIAEISRSSYLAY